MVTKDDKVYFVADDIEELCMIGAEDTENCLLRVPYKLNALCGKRIRGKKIWYNSLRKGECHVLLTLTTEFSVSRD